MVHIAVCFFKEKQTATLIRSKQDAIVTSDRIAMIQWSTPKNTAKGL